MRKVRPVQRFHNLMLMPSISAIPAVPTPLPTGSCVGPYVITACLGADLDGFDYAAEERHSGRMVLLREGCPVGLVRRLGTEVAPFDDAVEDFRDWLDSQSRLLDHWQRASRAIDPARLGHCALVSIEDRGEAHGTHWVSLCPPGGRSLRQVAEDGPGWPGRAMADAGLHTCCSALESLHRLGEFHGCLTPERVQVLDNGAWCLLLPDSDPARQPLSPWLALEQTEAGRAAGLAIGPWTDVHGIAALAHWLLTGSAPPSVARRQADVPDCWEELERVEKDPLRLRALRSALAVRPADRLGSVAALRMALGWSERHVPLVVEPRVALPPLAVPPPSPPPSPDRRHRAGVVALTGLVAAIGAVFALLWINHEPGQAESAAAVPAVAPVEVAAPAVTTARVQPTRPPVEFDPPGAGPQAPTTPVTATASKVGTVPASPAASAVSSGAKAARVPPAPPPASRPAAVVVRTGKPPPTDACIDWLRRRSLELADGERERNPACE